MSKVISSLVSFVAGCLLATALFHPKLFASSGQTQPNAQPQISVIDGMAAGRGSNLVHVAGAEPQVLPVRVLVRHGVADGAPNQILDGLICDECTFKDSKFVYAGGAFSLKNVSFSGETSIEFTGAAANTLVMLRFLDAMKAGQRPQPVNPKVPIVETAQLKATSPFEVKSPWYMDAAGTK